MATPPDPIAAVIEYLKADADILLLTQGRVYGGNLPQDDAGDMPRFSIVVQPSGGRDSGDYSYFYRQRMDIRTYGETRAQCGSLQLAVIRAMNDLKNKRLAHTQLYAALMESGRYSGVDALTFWPYEFTVWMVSTHLSEV